MQIQILFTTLTNTYNKFDEYMTLACSGLANLDKGFGMQVRQTTKGIDLLTDSKTDKARLGDFLS